MSNDRLKFRARFRSRSNGGECWQYLELGRVQTFGDQLPGVGWLQVTDWEQWTGLYDSEGVMIFEGDVVEYSEGDEWGVAVIEPVFNCCNLFFRWIKQNTESPSLFDAAHYFGYSKALKVVGNIYENPELLDA